MCTVPEWNDMRWAELPKTDHHHHHYPHYHYAHYHYAHYHYRHYDHYHHSDHYDMPIGPVQAGTMVH
jgi:hypothetical protein